MQISVRHIVKYPMELQISKVPKQVSTNTFIEYFFFGIKTQLFVLNHFHFIYTFIHLTVLLFSFCLIPLDTVLNYHKLLQMQKSNILLLKNFLGVFIINFQIILSIGEVLMAQKFWVISLLPILMFLMDPSKKFWKMQKI